MAAPNALTLAKGSKYSSGYGRERFGAGQNINAGATAVFDVDVSEFDNLTVLVSMAAAAAADLTVAVVPFDAGTGGTQVNGTGAGGGSPFGVVLPAALSTAVALVGANAETVLQYDLRGVDAVEIQVTNHNAAAKTLNFVDVFAGITGIT